MYPKYYHKFTVSDFLSLISGIFINKSEKARLLLRKIYGNKIFFFFDSGRTCLSILLKALNYPKYSELIVPINCCPVVPEAIKLNELVPVYVDIDNNLTILPEDLDRKITTKTRGVICVAQYGNVPDYGKIISICKKNNIDIIQDLAHTFTATYRENYLTEIGIASFFSLGVTKSITTFEGGILLLNDQKIDMDIISKYLKKRENIFTCFKRIAKFLFFVFGTKPPIYRLFTKRLVNLAKSMSFYQPKHRVLSKGALSLLCNILPRIQQIENKRRNRFKEIKEKMKIPDSEIYQLNNNRSSSCLVMPIKKDYFEKKLKSKIKVKVDFPEPLPLLKNYYDLNENYCNAERIYKNLHLLPTFELNWKGI